jgi:hypothetical protein
LVVTQRGRTLHGRLNLRQRLTPGIRHHRRIVVLQAKSLRDLSNDFLDA